MKAETLTQTGIETTSIGTSDSLCGVLIDYERELNKTDTVGQDGTPKDGPGLTHDFLDFLNTVPLLQENSAFSFPAVPLGQSSFRARGLFVATASHLLHRRRFADDRAAYFDVSSRSLYVISDVTSELFGRHAKFIPGHPEFLGVPDFIDKVVHKAPFEEGELFFDKVTGNCSYVNETFKAGTQKIDGAHSLLRAGEIEAILEDLRSRQLILDVSPEDHQSLIKRIGAVSEAEVLVTVKYAERLRREMIEFTSNMSMKRGLQKEYPTNEYIRSEPVWLYPYEGEFRFEDGWIIPADATMSIASDAVDFLMKHTNAAKNTAITET